jgi:hypothetical protein
MIAASRTKLTTVVFLVGCLCLPAIGHAVILSVQIIPTNPTDRDTVTFSVAGALSDACWSPQGFDFNHASPSHFNANVFAVDNWQPGHVCLEIIVPYEYSATIGHLIPGAYSVFVTEHHQSLRDPMPNTTLLTFEVTDTLSSIRNLVVHSSENNIILSWPAVENATGYRIYRATNPEFVIGQSNLVDSCTTTVYTEFNVIGEPERTFFYNVTATRW